MAPDREGGGISKLRATFEAYEAMPLPRLSAAAREIDGVDVDLFEEDSYLAGLASTAIGPSSISVPAIALDPGIDARLVDLARARPSDHSVTAMQDYRRAMRELAQVLSSVTGIPVRERTR